MAWNGFWKPSKPNEVNNNVCKYYYNHHGRKICGLDPKKPELCYLHEAKDVRIEIIERPTYTKLDVAAMAAANIILHHISIYGRIEYGIAIYGNKENNVFCLAETRIGDYGSVKSHSDYNIANRLDYTFKADVHSHPIFDGQQFSVGDYILSCGGRTSSSINRSSTETFLTEFKDEPGPHIKYLVRIPKREPDNWYHWSGENYKKDDIIYHNNQLWKAVKNCNGDNEPGATVMLWTQKCVEEWKKDGYYGKGEMVFHNDLLWTAKNPVKKNIPQTSSTIWTKYVNYNGPWNENKIYKVNEIVMTNDNGKTQFWKAIRGYDSNNNELTNMNYNPKTLSWSLYTDMGAELLKFTPSSVTDATTGAKDNIQARERGKMMAIVMIALLDKPNLYDVSGSLFNTRNTDNIIWKPILNTIKEVFLNTSKNTFGQGGYQYIENTILAKGRKWYNNDYPNNSISGAIRKFIGSVNSCDWETLRKVIKERYPGYANKIIGGTLQTTTIMKGFDKMMEGIVWTDIEN